MRSRWLGLMLVAVAIGFSLWAFPRLPPEVPTHWNVRGEPDGHSSRLLASLLIPGVMLGLWAVVQVLPSIDPKRQNYAQFFDTYWMLMNAILLFLGAVHVVMIGAGLGWAVDMRRLVPVGIGLLFVLIGNYLSRVQPNWFVGIRTPWTLSSETVWRKTHRTGGWLFVIGGVLMVGLAFLPSVTFVPLLAVIIGLVAVVPVVQSYLLWRREQRPARDAP